MIFKKAIEDLKRIEQDFGTNIKGSEFLMSNESRAELINRIATGLRILLVEQEKLNEISEATRGCND